MGQIAVLLLLLIAYLPVNTNMEYMLFRPEAELGMPSWIVTCAVLTHWNSDSHVTCSLQRHMTLSSCDILCSPYITNM